jgi:hypothetical protein
LKWVASNWDSASGIGSWSLQLRRGYSWEVASVVSRMWRPWKAADGDIEEMYCIIHFIYLHIIYIQEISLY